MPSIPRAALLDGSFHHHLLRDEKRLDAYARAIAATVRPGDIVADIGSGSGILAYLCIQAGAARVHAIESNTNSYAALLRTVRRNDLLGRVIPTLADGTQWVPNGAVDVVICELMETGLLHEPIAAVVRDIRSWEHEPRAFVPNRVELLVEAVETHDKFMGYHASFPGFRATGADPAVSNRVTYAAYDMERDTLPESIDATFELRVTRAGHVSGIQLHTETEVSKGVHLGESPAYCTPVVLTLDDAIEVRTGDLLSGRLTYDFDYTSEPLTFDLAVKRA